MLESLGGLVDDTALGDALTLSPETLTICLVVYGFVASIRRTTSSNSSALSVVW